MFGWKKIAAYAVLFAAVYFLYKGGDVHPDETCNILHTAGRFYKISVMIVYGFVAVGLVFGFLWQDEYFYSKCVLTFFFF